VKRIIFISGCSGSGKTTLALNLSKSLTDSIILSTDNYYKTGIRAKISSFFNPAYHDKIISLDIKRIMRDFHNILDNKVVNIFQYDYISKSLTFKNKSLKGYDYIIIEGIFAYQLADLFNNPEAKLILCEEDKLTCLCRVIKRDKRERGRKIKNIVKNFNLAWDIYRKNNIDFIKNHPNITKVNKHISQEIMLSIR
tara:strand:+ start:298 stop:885 length:588 start_codon:yes stop_codon:yes gene_type:complete